MASLKIGVIGVGSIGGHLAGVLLAGGAEVTLCLRQRQLAEFRAKGLQVQYLNRQAQIVQKNFASSAMSLTSAPEVPSVDLLILTIKTHQWPSLLQEWVSAGRALPAVILCLQNGVEFHERVRADLAQATLLQGVEVVGGMVPFNVVQDEGVFRQTSLGPYYFSQTSAPEIRRLGEHLQRANFTFVHKENFVGFQWTKFLLNLNNAINALSGEALDVQLANPVLRSCLASAIQEGIQVAHKKGVVLEKLQGLSAPVMLRLLRLPNWLFLPLLKLFFRIEKGSRTSMAQDFLAGRKTEIDTLNGWLAQEALAVGLRAETNEYLVKWVKSVEAAQFSLAQMQEARGSLESGAWAR